MITIECRPEAHRTLATIGQNVAIKALKFSLPFDGRTLFAIAAPAAKHNS